MYTHKPISITMQVPSRPDSRFISHLVMAFLEKTYNAEDTELLIMPGASDKWNKDLFEYITRSQPSVRVIPETEEEGQRGHHKYLNQLAKYAKGDWILNFCDDMDILLRDWDEIIREFIRERQLDPDKCYMIVPRFKVAGAVEHILSKGWIRVTGKVCGYPNGDSWLNTVVENTPQPFQKDRRLSLETCLFEDFTQSEELRGLFPKVDGPRQEGLKWESEEVQSIIREDAGKLWEAYKNGY